MSDFIQPNADLVRFLMVLLADVRVGKYVNMTIVGWGEDASGEHWVQHFSVPDDKDMPRMLGEVELMQDALKYVLHQTRNKATAIQRIGSISGAS